MWRHPLDEVFFGRVTVVPTTESLSEHACVVEDPGKRYSCADAASLHDGIVRIGEVVSPVLSRSVTRSGRSRFPVMVRIEFLDAIFADAMGKLCFGVP